MRKSSTANLFIALLLSTVALTHCAFGSDAEAARVTVRKGFWGAAANLRGRPDFTDFRTMRKLGAGTYNTRLSWANVAPTKPANPRSWRDPAYRWPTQLTNDLVRAKRWGMRVALEVRNAPPWANGNRPLNWVPKRAKDYADFIWAATHRYPSVKVWIVWSEPTRKASLSPNIPQVSPTTNLDKARRWTPHFYARMLDGAYGQIKKSNKRDLVVGGNTFLAGDISPYNWIRNLKLPNGRAPRMDLYGHNPFGARRPDLRMPNVRPGLADFSDLDTLAHWVDRYIGRHNGRRLPLGIGEICWPTDHPSHELNVWVDRSVQASWLGDALKILRRWKRIAAMNWIWLYDEPPRPGGDENACGLMDDQGR